MPREGQWEVPDGTSSEVEMGDFLYGLVRMLKPALVVETGTYLGHSTRLLVEACFDNGFGKVVSCDVEDRNVFNAIPSHCELRICSSLDLPELGTADLVYSDSEQNLRMKEYELVKPGCVFVVHDTARSYTGNPDQSWLGKWVRANGGITFDAGRGFGILCKK